MPGWVRKGSFLLSATAVCVLMGGCAAAHDDSLRLGEELGRARAEAAWQQARAAELESRISRLEQRAAATTSTRSAEERELSIRLERLIAFNERLLAERPEPPRSATTGPAGPSRTAAPDPLPATAAAAATPTSALVPDEEQQLRALVERMRGRPGSPRGGLTPQQEAALRVLLRPERTLDTESPWAGFY